MSDRKLILASASPYRRQLLERLGLPFEVVAADLDETVHAGEPAQALVRRLAEAKAMIVAEAHPQATVIGCDQVADCGGQILGKPGDMARAMAQLQAVQGRSVIFRSALAVLTPEQAPMIEVIPTHVHFRSLDQVTLRRYLERDRPFDCAGAFRSEALGIALTDAITSDDPTALIGLPLIALSAMLRRAGWAIP